MSVFNEKTAKIRWQLRLQTLLACGGWSQMAIQMFRQPPSPTF